jgi:tRNA uridine 5-carbamoylmethylation protein Kti12
MPGCYLIVIYGAPFSGKTSLAWQVARGLSGKTAVVSVDHLLTGAIAVPDLDADAELEMVHVQLRLLTANYLKNRYHVVVEGPFVFERDGRVIDYEAEIGQLIALMRNLVQGSLIVRLEAPPDVISQRARDAGREHDAAAALRLRDAYQGRYEGRALRLDSRAGPVDALAREVRGKLEQAL